MGTVIPGSRLENNILLAKKEISNLYWNDFVIIWGCANDINKNETNIGLKYIRNFAVQNIHTNSIIITALHKHDLQDSSCINREIHVYNRKLHKIMKVMGHVNINDTNFTRNEFTHHRLHLNTSGKEKMANLIAQSITNLLTRQKSFPVSLK
jgi:lysophospholipase L1-like esterase